MTNKTTKESVRPYQKDIREMTRLGVMYSMIEYAPVIASFRALKKVLKHAELQDLDDLLGNQLIHTISGDVSVSVVGKPQEPLGDNMLFERIDAEVYGTEEEKVRKTFRELVAGLDTVCGKERFVVKPRTDMHNYHASHVYEWSADFSARDASNPLCSLSTIAKKLNLNPSSGIERKNWYRREAFDGRLEADKSDINYTDINYKRDDSENVLKIAEYQLVRNHSAPGSESYSRQVLELTGRLFFPHKVCDPLFSALTLYAADDERKGLCDLLDEYVPLIEQICGAKNRHEIK